MISDGGKIILHAPPPCSFVIVGDNLGSSAQRKIDKASGPTLKTAEKYHPASEFQSGIFCHPLQNFQARRPRWRFNESEESANICVRGAQARPVPTFHPGNGFHKYRRCGRRSARWVHTFRQRNRRDRRAAKHGFAGKGAEERPHRPPPARGDHQAPEPSERATQIREGLADSGVPRLRETRG